MMKILKYIGVVTIVTALGVTSCESLDTENLNELDGRAVYADPTTYGDVVDGGFLSWWQAIQLNDPNMAVSVAAQTLSSSWGNWGMQDLGTIPRQPIQNTFTYARRDFMTTPWGRLNASLGQVNEVLRAMNDQYGGQIEDENGNDITNQVLANAKMLQGLNLGWLGLIFDQAGIVDETVPLSDLPSIQLSPYNEVIEAGVTKFLEAAALFESTPTATHTAISGINYNNVEAAGFCRSYAAKLLAYKSRNGAETQANDWARILTIANGGLNDDINPVGDDNYWWSRILINGQYPLWGRVSQRVINMMEGGTGSGTTTDAATTTAPYPWPNGVATLPKIANPRDNRINTDFNYNTGVQFQSSRGYYFFSSYNYRRYETYYVNYLGEMPHLTLNEQNLIKAEALVRTGGDKIQAAQYINNTRVDRGGLTPLLGTESDDVLLKAITYERLVEFAWDGALNGWFHRRMTTVDQYKLQPGTFEQLPIPAQELEILGVDVYTFGGV
ncbi:RagB/SusD family nutrient uptake outer membrane protein [Roseivirga echinicomitans]